MPFDVHESLGGVLPTILGIPSYSIFVGLGILVGIVYYLLDARRRGVKHDGVVVIVASALIFGVIGSKIPLLFESNNPDIWAYGKSIVGAMLGGMLGVILVKRIMKIKLKMGNIIAPAVALGMAIGRIGCFCNGCCFGIPAPFGLGFNFGDGVLRLQTQLLESVFHLTAFFILRHYQDKVKTPGILFKLYLLAYFIFRFLCEFIRENPRILLDMTIYQIFCIIGIIYMGFALWRGKVKQYG